MSASKLAKTVNFQLDVLLFSNFDVFLDFKDVNIEIWKNEDQFTFILFCKESESEIRNPKLFFLNFDPSIGSVDL